jgi:hypothetical protein
LLRLTFTVLEPFGVLVAMIVEPSCPQHERQGSHTPRINRSGPARPPASVPPTDDYHGWVGRAQPEFLHAAGNSVTSLPWTPSRRAYRSTESGTVTDSPRGRRRHRHRHRHRQVVTSQTPPEPSRLRGASCLNLQSPVSAAEFAFVQQIALSNRGIRYHQSAPPMDRPISVRVDQELRSGLPHIHCERRPPGYAALKWSGTSNLGGHRCNRCDAYRGGAQ